VTRCLGVAGPTVGVAGPSWVADGCGPLAVPEARNHHAVLSYGGGLVFFVVSILSSLRITICAGSLILSVLGDSIPVTSLQQLADAGSAGMS